MRLLGNMLLKKAVWPDLHAFQSRFSSAAMIDPAVKNELHAVFLNARRDERGKELLDKMMIDKFILIEDSVYDSMREMKSWISRHKER